MTTPINERKVFCQVDACKKTRDRLDQYVKAYEVWKAKAEAMEVENKELKAELSRSAESAKKAVIQARQQQKNSKERAQRLAEKLKKLEGATA